MTSKQLLEKALKELSNRQGDDIYVFSPDGMQTFIEQLCKEQRKECLKFYKTCQINRAIELQEEIKFKELGSKAAESILNAPKPLEL